MTDNVALLRELAEEEADFLLPSDHSWLNEAADEIERLRAEVGFRDLRSEQLQSRLTSCEQALANAFDEADQLRAEVERLKVEPHMVKIPTSADEAQLMANLGLQWLGEHAPERLTDTGRSWLKVSAVPEWCDEMASAGFNELDRRGFRVGASDLGCDDLKGMFYAMLAAAPQPPTEKPAPTGESHD